MVRVASGATGGRLRDVKEEQHTGADIPHISIRAGGSGLSSPPDPKSSNEWGSVTV